MRGSLLFAENSVAVQWREVWLGNRWLTPREGRATSLGVPRKPGASGVRAQRRGNAEGMCPSICEKKSPLMTTGPHRRGGRGPAPEEPVPPVV